MGRGRSLRDLVKLAEAYEHALRNGRTDHMHARCPHCRRLITVTLIDGLILVPDRPGIDREPKAAHRVSCPNVNTCGKDFAMKPPKGWHFETWDEELQHT